MIARGKTLLLATKTMADWYCFCLHILLYGKSLYRHYSQFTLWYV